VATEEVGEPLAEHARRDNDRTIARLDEVRARQFHRKRSGSGDDERLAGRAQPDLAHRFERAPERLGETRREVTRRWSPKRLVHLGFELDRAGDHEQRTTLHRLLLLPNPVQPIFAHFGRLSQTAPGSWNGRWNSTASPVQ